MMEGEPDSRSISRQTEMGQKTMENVEVQLKACRPWSGSILRQLIMPTTNPIIEAEYEQSQRRLEKATSAMELPMVMLHIIVKNKSATNWEAAIILELSLMQKREDWLGLTARIQSSITLLALSSVKRIQEVDLLLSKRLLEQLQTSSRRSNRDKATSSLII